MLSSILYKVEFPDGRVKEYAAHVIVDNMLCQVDSEGFSTTMMEAIVDYRKDDATAVNKSDQYVITKKGQSHLRNSTVGWK